MIETAPATEQSADIAVWECTHDEYHADGANSVSHSGLDVFIDSPEKYHAKYLAKTLVDSGSKALDLGIVFHDMVLGDAYDPDGDFDAYLVRQQQFVPIPNDVLNKDGHRKGKSWTSFKDDHDGAILLTASEYEPMEKWFTAISDHPKARLLLFQSRGHNEHTLVWTCQETGVRRRCRMDRLIPHRFIVDLKTARDCSPHWFSKHAYDCGYHRQVAFYQDGTEALCGKRLPFVFITIEKEAPFRCECFELDAEFIEQGRRENRRALHRLAECQRTGYWHTETYGKVIRIAAPSWARNSEQWHLDKTGGTYERA